MGAINILNLVLPCCFLGCNYSNTNNTKAPEIIVDNIDFDKTLEEQLLQYQLYLDYSTPSN